MSNADKIEKRWYALRSFSGHELKVKQLMDAEISRLNLQDEISQVVVPMEKVYEVRDGKKRTRQKNFLPGYVLVEAILTKRSKDLILNTPSVMSIMGRKSEPEPLHEDEISKILGRIEERKSVETIETAFRAGDPVRIIDGHFSNFSGFVTEVNNSEQKLKVEVSIFGRKTPIELDYTQVEIER